MISMFYFSPKNKIEMQGQDEQWRRALEYVSLVSELNYMTQVGCQEE
jgi:hypothetical protein